MRKNINRRILSFLLMLCMLLSILPLPVIAEETAEAAQETELPIEQTVGGDTSISYSDLSVSFDAMQTLLSELSGETTVTLRRGGNVGESLTLTLLVYDNNARYGEDYRLWYGGEAVEKIDGATTIYDAFRDGGRINEGWTMTVTGEEIEQAEADGEIRDEIPASDMFAELDELNVLAARIPVTFAAGESTTEITVEVLDDALSEYEETFLLAVLDSNGEVIEDATLLLGIEDNEEAPTVIVSFDCAQSLVVDADSGTAALTFCRVGDLATSTEALLLKDGEILGYVDFSPYQETQIVYAEVGTYTLSPGDGYSVSPETVKVYATDGSVTVPEGADPDLDAIPNAYAPVGDGEDETPATRSPSWFPSWARNSGTTENYDAIIYMNGNSNKTFDEKWVKGVGDYSYSSGDGVHDLDTSGTRSRIKTGYVQVWSRSKYDMTGIESIEITGRVEGLDYSNQVIIGLHTGSYEVGRNTVDNSNSNANVTTRYYLKEKTQGSYYVFVENKDPTKSDDGCHYKIPNGFKANKRTYRIVVEDPIPLNFFGVGLIDINAQKKSGNMLLKMSSDSKINIAYEVEDYLPVKLVGYRVKNLSSGALTGIIPLNGSSQITFDKAFLQAYESTYCFNSQFSGNTYCTFAIVPVFEKIPVTVELEDAKLGTISIKDTYYEGQTFYVGEKLVIQGDPVTGAHLSGVYFKFYKNTSASISLSGTIDAASTGLVTVDLGSYNRVVLQGSFRTTSDRLMVNYVESNAANRHGKLAFNEGVVVKPSEYVKNDYFPLVAQADDGYITKWESDGRVYYGDTFYYQLDGNANHNWITVEFVPKSSLSMKIGTLRGTMNVADVQLRTCTDTTVPLANVDFVIYADKEYTGTTDEKGNFTVSNFYGVIGGTYSMQVVYRDMIGYTTFTPFMSSTASTVLDITMPQFATGSIYPSDISVSLGYVTSSDNYIQVNTTDTGSITVQVTNEAKGDISAVTLHFLSTREENYGAEVGAVKMTLDKELTAQVDSGLYSYWTAEITDATALPLRSQMYVSVTATKPNATLDITTDSDGNIIRTAVSTTTVACNSGLVDSGYQLIQAVEDNSIIIEQSIPDVPGATNAYSTGSELKIPVLGWADFSLTSSTGGYFVQKVQNGTTYLICGYSIAPVYGVSTLDKKIEGAIQTQDYLNAKQSASTQQIAGGADPEAILLGQGTGTQAGQAAGQTEQKKSSNWSIDPAFYFKFALTPGVDADGNDKTYITGFEMALGFDAYYMKNIPFSVQGIPMYICFTTQVEALVQVQTAMKVDAGGDTTLSMYELCHVPGAADEAENESASFIAVPKLSLGLKSGVGYNSLLSAYVSGTVSVPMIFQVDPYFDAAGEIGFAFNAGADLVFFTANYKVLSVAAKFGNEDIYDDLSTVQAAMNKKKQTTYDVIDTTVDENTRVLAEGEDAPSVEEMLNSMTFSFMERPTQGTNLMRSATVDSQTLAENVFKNTKIQLIRLGNGDVMALFLVDNGENGYNYLSAAYAVSSDNGATWSDINFVSSNIGQANTSLQFDISVFELEDRILITWSAADFDALLSELDKDNLTIGQIASLMNAMNLCGRFFDKETGEPMGEAFTIAEHSTVSCGALDAVQNGENVYVYYQRNSFPTGEDVELTDLFATDRTIALARANVNEPENWTSTSVRALNENGQQYRITEVTPFVHDGVMGEILVIDRNGKLSSYDAQNDEWTADNEDRQLYLRTYEFGEDGTPQATALIALTDAADCAQSPQVVSNDDYLYLFWNENGSVVYLSDFIVTADEHEDVQIGAVLLKNADGTMTVQEVEAINGTPVAVSDAMTVGTTFTASMADDGNVLLAWIGDDVDSGDLVPTDEIYGVILNSVTNAEAMARSGETDFEDEGNENVYQLWPVGAPIALTDEDSLIGALDSICMESGAENKFLLAFTKLNAATRDEVTSADILAVLSTDAPRLEITEISAESYPMPGSEMSVQVTVANYGLEPLKGGSVSLSGVGETATATFDGNIQPGEIAMVDLTVSVPEDFRETTQLVATVGGIDSQAAYTAEGEFIVNYGAYFALDEMSSLIAVPNSKDCESVTKVRNIGNAAGAPTLTFVNTIYGSGEYELDYVFESDAVIEPGEAAEISYTLTDTLINEQKTAYLRVSVGDHADQSAASHMPVATLSAADRPTVNSAEAVFTDVSDHWAKDEIDYVYAEGLMNGMSATTFEPETAMTRAMLVTVIYRMAGSPEVSGTVPYTDVLDNFWYTDAIVWASQNGIVNGIGKGLFDPDSGVTREQMATILYRYAEFVGLDVSSRSTLDAFPDAAQCSEYAAEPLSWAFSLGLIVGTRKVDTVYLDPQGYATRAQTATVVRRFRETLLQEAE